MSVNKNSDNICNPPQNDLLLTGTTRKWIKPENCIIRGKTIVFEGPPAQYSPFDKYPEILVDFLALTQKIDELNSGMCEFLGMQRQSSKAKEEIRFLEKDVLEEYKKFVILYGILGVGISRILDINRRTYDKKTGVTTSSVNIKSIYLKGKPDFDNPGRPYIDQSLPEYGGEILIEDWNNAYGGISWSDYKETLTQIMDCEIIWKIIEDIKAEKRGETKDFCFSSDGVCVTFIKGIPGFSWEFSSLIQAISIMYGSNKAGKFGTRVLQCPTCGKFFTTEDVLRKYCYRGTCKDTMSKRKYRNRKSDLIEY